MPRKTPKPILTANQKDRLTHHERGVGLECGLIAPRECALQEAGSILRIFELGVLQPATPHALAVIATGDDDVDVDAYLGDQSREIES